MLRLTEMAGELCLIDIIKGCLPVALRESRQEEHAALRYPANSDPQSILAREQRLVRDNQASDWTPTEATYARTRGTKAASGADGISAHLSSSEYDALLAKITELKELVQRQHGEGAPVVRQQRVQQRQQQQRTQQPRGFRVGQHKAPPVGFDRDDQRATPFCGRCKKAGKGESYHFYRDCPLGGRQHLPTSVAAFCVPIDEEDAEGVRALAMCGLFQQAADDGAGSFARATTAYGPPAVLCAGAVGGIDVSAYGFAVEQQSGPDEPVHFTHAYFPPPDGIEQQASAVVCGPAAAGITPEEQVPAGRAAASASAVPAPTMPVSQEKDVEPVPLQSARVTATAATDCEFAGFVQTANHAAIAQVDLTGYDTDDYEDLADGCFIVKPRAPVISVNHASESTAHAPRSGGAHGDWSGGASRTYYGCGKPPWDFPAHAGTWGMPYILSIILLISVMGVGAAAFTTANDIESLQVSGQAAPDRVGDLCIYSSITELDPVALDAVLHSLGAAAVAHAGCLTHWSVVLRATTMDIVVTVLLWTLTPSSYAAGSGSTPLFWWYAEMYFNINGFFTLVYGFALTSLQSSI
ncbi:hypothetical protein CYMTET_44209 [Cymbomonas tetramitiformis]|uniref:Uncharacterized protein n=1 Tax=Cymbomonas tetramitiformis TaxID=36881 RepID=A0AAE0C0R3_9CHLO|nr:hypothetical protein CYMTET_44209 [Cymbomonas tetramitiformis]